jgi:hypothetical protein
MSHKTKSRRNLYRIKMKVTMEVPFRRKMPRIKKKKKKIQTLKINLEITLAEVRMMENRRFIRTLKEPQQNLQCILHPEFQHLPYKKQ